MYSTKTLIVLIILPFVRSEIGSGNCSISATEDDTNANCHCMDYWSCILSGGQAFSYCGIRNREVCCSVERTSRNIIRTDNDDKISKPNTTQQNETQISDELLQLLQSSNTNYLIQTTTSSSRSSMNVSVSVSSVSSEISSPEICGKSINNGHIDSFAKFKEWPWHVAILEAKDDVYICGGSFIQNQNGSQLILTTGHCVVNYVNSTKRLKVRFGEYDVSTNREPIPHIEVLVRNITLHPLFKNDGQLENDIAILKLNNSIQLSQIRDNIRPICLPNNELQFVTNTKSRKCVVTGWGRRNELSPFSIILKEIAVPVWEHKTCEQKLNVVFGPNYTLPKNLLCAGEDNHDACDGDGGGPLVCFENNRWIQYGIVSFGISCGTTVPGIYTNVSFYTNWLKSLF